MSTYDLFLLVVKYAKLFPFRKGMFAKLNALWLMFEHKPFCLDIELKCKWHIHTMDLKSGWSETIFNSLSAFFTSIPHHNFESRKMFFLLFLFWKHGWWNILQYEQKPAIFKVWKRCPKLNISELIHSKTLFISVASRVFLVLKIETYLSPYENIYTY